MAQNRSNWLKNVEFDTFGEYMVNFDGNNGQFCSLGGPPSMPPKLLGGSTWGAPQVSPPSKSRGLWDSQNTSVNGSALDAMHTTNRIFSKILVWENCQISSNSSLLLNFFPIGLRGSSWHKIYPRAENGLLGIAKCSWGSQNQQENNYILWRPFIPVTIYPDER